MPRARANIRAKLSAQIDTGNKWVSITSEPAATSRPTMVSISGSPAATRLPKAITRMTIVTGHDSISERSIAERLAVVEVGPQRTVTGEGDRDAGARQGVRPGRRGRRRHGPWRSGPPPSRR